MVKKKGQTDVWSFEIGSGRSQEPGYELLVTRSSGSQVRSSCKEVGCPTYLGCPVSRTCRDLFSVDVPTRLDLSSFRPSVASLPSSRRTEPSLAGHGIPMEDGDTGPREPSLPWRWVSETPVSVGRTFENLDWTGCTNCHCGRRGHKKTFRFPRVSL